MSAASQAIDQAVAQAAQEQQGATSTAPIDRGTEPVTGPTDPRFDRDDLRQGHPPPAVRQGKLRVSVKRLRKNKGTPYDAATEKDAKHDEAELTEEVSR